MWHYARMKNFFPLWLNCLIKMFNAPEVCKCNRERYINRKKKKNFLRKKSTFSDVVGFDSMFELSKFTENIF